MSQRPGLREACSQTIEISRCWKKPLESGDSPESETSKILISGLLFKRVGQALNETKLQTS